MNIHQIDNPDDRAEGTCAGIPFNTELVSIDGVSMHLWIGGILATDRENRLAEAVRIGHETRDVVCFTWSDGAPTGY